MLLLFKIIIFLGIMNVWFVRSKTKTNWRGGNAVTLKDEFQVYALPEWTFYFVGGTKTLSALFIFLSIWIKEVPYEFFAIVLSILMIFAILMHLKVRDKHIKSMPALCMLVVSMMTLYF